jgi:hypothetical protein
MSDGVGSRMGVLDALSLSVTSSVAIVIWNKYFINTLGFFSEHMFSVFPSCSHQTYFDYCFRACI